MKKVVPLALCAALTLGLVAEASARLTPLVSEPATDAPAQPVALVELDLRPQGAPLSLMVPAGTTASKADEFSRDIRIDGPDFNLRLTVPYGNYAAAQKEYARLRDGETKEGYTKVVAEDATSYRLRHGTDTELEDRFGMLVGKPEYVTNYLLMKGFKDDYSGYTPAQVEQMYASAKTIHFNSTPELAIVVSPPATQLVDLDLTPNGLPVVIRVPQGTKVSESIFGLRLVSGNNFALSVSNHPGGAKEATKDLALGKKTYMGGIAESFTTLVDQPTQYRLHNKEEDSDDYFEVALVSPSGEFYTFSPAPVDEEHLPPLGPYFGPANTQAMFDAARGARIKGGGAAAPAVRKAPVTQAKKR